MRRPAAAWSWAWGMVAAATCIVVGCSLSLRGVGNPDGPFSTPTPYVAGGPPTVEIASPADGTNVATGDSVYFDVRATDPWPVGIVRLELFADDTLVARATPPGGASRASFGALLEWMPLAPGPYTLTAFAYRADGTASPPATVELLVSGALITPSPSATLTPPPASPSFTALPSLTPSALPSVTLTPSPTPAPIPAFIDVWVEPNELPAWTVGVAAPLIVHVQNIGGTNVPDIRVVARLAGDRGTGRSGPLAAGRSTTLIIWLTPESSGAKRLSAEGDLPPGYYDGDPINNTLLWEGTVLVLGQATPDPTPTDGPQPTPTDEPAPTPTAEPEPTPTGHGPPGQP